MGSHPKIRKLKKFIPTTVHICYTHTVAKIEEKFVFLIDYDSRSTVTFVTADGTCIMRALGANVNMK